MTWNRVLNGVERKYDENLKKKKTWTREWEDQKRSKWVETDSEKETSREIVREGLQKQEKHEMNVEKARATEIDSENEAGKPLKKAGKCVVSDYAIVDQALSAFYHQTD